MGTYEQFEAAIALVAEDGIANFLQTEEGPMLFLNCNDVFGYACADAEPVPWDSIVEVKRLFDKGGWEATIDWVAKRRGTPQLYCPRGN